MGRFVNPDSSAFQVALNSRIYVDKTGLIEYTNSVLDTTNAYICNSRPRRFGKSYAANMLGSADFVFIPKPEYKSTYPALVVELKWNKDTEAAIQQIKNKRYPESVLHYTGDILLVGINYDTHSKVHQCLIEKYEKD